MTSRSSRLSPRPALAPYVRHVRVAFPDPAAPPYVRLPDAELELVVQVSGADTTLHAVGTRLAPLHKPGQVPRQALVVRFKAAGAYPFFGVPLFELTDRVLSIEELWGERGAQLAEALHGAPDSRARVAMLEEALLARLGASTLFEPASSAAVRRAVRLVQGSSVLPSVEALAEQLGASTRQLRRAFAAVVGLGPKEYLRVVRFQRALQRARQSPALSWSSIAAATGYYDQAHLSAEFQALAGTTPGSLVRARRAPAHAERALVESAT